MSQIRVQFQGITICPFSPQPYPPLVFTLLVHGEANYMDPFFTIPLAPG